MIVVGQKALSLKDFSAIVLDKEIIELDKDGLGAVSENYDFLKTFSSNKIIYGINTGFGPMAQYRISEENLVDLQYNLIRSHCAGSGNLLPALLSRALMIARLSSLMRAYSGVHPDLVLLLTELINRDINPCIYERGGVGASGDLVQLAHLGLSLIGEGEVIYGDTIYPTAEIFEKLGIKPLIISGREGLAIVNGTSAMTGIGLINVLLSRRLVHWSVILSCMMNEVVEAYHDHYSEELNRVKDHTGQNHIAERMRFILSDSRMIRNRSEHLYAGAHVEKEFFEDKVQEYYSLRCVTQILGPVWDTVLQAEKVLTTELNSVNDNPVIDHLHWNIFHGGNFHGDYVSLEMDKLKIAITKLSMLSERQLNYLLNNKLNQKFPPFVNLGVLGLNFGMQGMQFTATSTVAENQTLSFPMYVHSIPNNNDNQDIVSMGCNAALITRKVIDNAFTVLGVQAVSVLQVVDYLACQESLSPVTRTVYQNIRKIFPVTITDSARYKELQAVSAYLQATEAII